MGKDKDEFNDLAAEADQAVRNGGPRTDLRTVLGYFNGLAEKQAGGEAQPSVSTGTDLEFGERLTRHIKDGIKETVDKVEREKMEAVSKPHAQKVKAIAARRDKKAPG